MRLAAAGTDTAFVSNCQQLAPTRRCHCAALIAVAPRFGEETTMAEQDLPPSGASSLDDKYTTGIRPRISPATRRWCAVADDPAGARPGRRAQHRRALCPATGVPPLGGLDQPVEGRDHLAEHDIVFQPGVNEDLAATAGGAASSWPCRPKARVQGVLRWWYGRPGVDRCGDVFRHANAAGSSRSAACWRSPATTTRPVVHPAPPDRPLLRSMMMPVLAPAGCRNTSTTACMAGRCRAIRAAGWLQGAGRHRRTSASVDVDPSG